MIFNPAVQIEKELSIEPGGTFRGFPKARRPSGAANRLSFQNQLPAATPLFFPELTLLLRDLTELLCHFLNRDHCADSP